MPSRHRVVSEVSTNTPRERSRPMTDKADHISEETMAKHHQKVAKALAKRQAAAPNDRGFHKPGSMNPRKTGYWRVRSNG